jgi:hypothetical protein
MNQSKCATRWVLLPFIISVVLPDVGVAGADSLHVVILSQRVGETIDRTEQARYHLFDGIDALDSARVFQIDSGRFRVVFTLADPSGVQRESTAVISLAQAFRLSEIIDNIEEIQQMRYVSRQSALTIWVDGRAIVRAAAQFVAAHDPAERTGSSKYWRPGYDRNLPLGEAPGPQPRSMQYVFFIGAGMNFHTGSITTVESMYAEIESRYGRSGFPVHGTPSTFDVIPRMLYVLMIRPFESVRFTAEVSPPPSDGDLTIGYVSGFVDYRVPVLRSERICWESGIGLTFFSFGAVRKYGGVRVSPIDTLKGYYVLDQILADGFPVGISVQTGIALLASPQAEFIVYARNTWCSKVNVGLSGGSVATLRFSDFHLGIRFVVGLY